MIDIRRADERFHTEIDWLDSWHSFSFSNHYDPKNTHHGLLLVLNDDVIAAGGGFGTHPHRDMEIVTWVLDGALEHRDSEGNDGVITPGVAQRMSAGTRHPPLGEERERTEPVHLLQMWVPPDTPGSRPATNSATSARDKQDDELFPLASGREADAAIRIHQRDATLWVARARRRRPRRWCPTRRSCTCWSPRGARDARRRGRARRGRRGAPHRRRRARARRPPRTAPRSSSGRCGPTSKSADYLTRRDKPAIGEHLAAGLTRRAVHDLVRLVRDALQVGPALGTRQARLAVHGEVLAQLVLRQPARRADARVRVPRPAPPATRRACARVRRASTTSATRTATAWRGAGCRRRSRARRPRPCAGRAGSCGCGDRRSAVRNHSANSSLVASGPSFSSGPASSGASTHQPALRSVPNSRSNTARSSENRQRTTEPFGVVFFGGCLEIEPTGLREVEHDAQVVVEVQRHVLRPPVDADDRARRSSASGGGSYVFNPVKPSGS